MMFEFAQLLAACLYVAPNAHTESNAPVMPQPEGRNVLAHARKPWGNERNVLSPSGGIIRASA